jgi:hypothetical protein
LLAALTALACTPKAPPPPVNPQFALRDLQILQATITAFTRGDSSNVPFVMLNRSDTVWAAGDGEALWGTAETRAWPFIDSLVAANGTSRELPCADLQPVRRPVVCVSATDFLVPGRPDWAAVRSVVPGTNEVWSLSMPAVDSTGGHAYVVLNRYCAPGSSARCDEPFTLELCFSSKCPDLWPGYGRLDQWLAWRVQRLPADPDL